MRAKPVLVPQAPLPLEATLRVAPPSSLPIPAPKADATADSQAFGSLRVLARVSRERRRRAQQQAQAESGEAGKAGAKTAAAPLPIPDPKSEAAKAEPPEPDEWSEAEIITALKDCLKRLAPLGAEIDIAPAVKHEQCGAPAPVLLKRIGSGASRVEFQPPPMLNCAMVASLHTWIEKTLQPAAQDILGSSIVRLRGTSGYACRNRNGSAHGDRLSEHALANAIDIMGFVTADGRTIDVLNKWGPTARDIREQKERVAEARRNAPRKPRAAKEAKAAKIDDKEALQAARDAAKQAQKEAVEAEKSAAKAPRHKRKQAQAEAQRKKDEAERKAEIAERLGEEAEQRASEAAAGIAAHGRIAEARQGRRCEDHRRQGHAHHGNGQRRAQTHRGSDVPAPPAQGCLFRVRHGAGAGSQRGPPQSLPFRSGPAPAQRVLRVRHCHPGGRAAAIRDPGSQTR